MTLLSPLSAEIPVKDLACLTLVKPQLHVGCNGIKSQMECLRSRDGRSAVEWQGIQIANQPCVWCGGLRCTNLGDAFCEPADLMIRGQAMGVWKHGAPPSSLTIATCPVSPPATSPTSHLVHSFPKASFFFVAQTSPQPTTPMATSATKRMSMSATTETPSMLRSLDVKRASSESNLRSPQLLSSNSESITMQTSTAPTASASTLANASNINGSTGNWNSSKVNSGSADRIHSSNFPWWAWIILTLSALLCLIVPMFFMRRCAPKRKKATRALDEQQVSQPEQERNANPLLAPASLQTSVAPPVYVNQPLYYTPPPRWIQWRPMYSILPPQ